MKDVWFVRERWCLQDNRKPVRLGEVSSWILVWSMERRWLSRNVLIAELQNTTRIGLSLAPFLTIEALSIQTIGKWDVVSVFTSQHIAVKDVISENNLIGVTNKFLCPPVKKLIDCAGKEAQWHVFRGQSLQIGKATIL